MTKTALELIQQGWTQQASARDAFGVKVDYDSYAAVCWCSIGAICAIYGSEYARAIKRLKEVVGNEPNIALWNDKPGRTKEEVIDAFAKAGI